MKLKEKKINLYDNFKLLTPKEDQLRRTTFLDVIKLLTKRGEAKRNYLHIIQVLDIRENNFSI